MMTMSDADARLITLENDAQTYEITDDKKWIGVDFDGTLVEFDTWQGVEHVGKPLELMIAKVKGLLAQGIQVRIFTARVSDEIQFIDLWSDRLNPYGFSPFLKEKIKLDTQARQVIREWTQQTFGQSLDATNTKDCFCIGLYDDIAVQMVPNTGKTLADQHQAEYLADKGGKPK